MLLAALDIRHTRRHMPIRRVALEQAYLPTSGPGHGIALLGAVVREHLPAVEDDGRELLVRLLRDARSGLSIPRIALRHRLQHDVHGLDRSSHRMLGEDGAAVVELDLHGSPVPQVLGAVLGAASLPGSARAAALDVIGLVVAGRWRGLARGVTVRRLAGSEWDAPPLATPGQWRPGGPPEEVAWSGFDPDLRWAMETLGLRAGMRIARGDVNRRFRRLLREAHPDGGGNATAAAARIAELTEARTLLLAVASDEVAGEG
ncbi:MAG: hypothetical protein ACKO1Y_08550 [Actinomycetota bacterium]